MSENRQDTAVTPGQASCIAWNAHYAEGHGITARNEWAASDERGRGAWEAAAVAGHEAIAAAAPAPQPAPEIRTCYCGTTATVMPGTFPHPDCDGSVLAQPAPELAEVRGQVLAEVLAWIENPAIMRPELPVIAGWRERARMEPQR